MIARALLLFLLSISLSSAQIVISGTNKQVTGTLEIVNGGTQRSTVCSSSQIMISNGTTYDCVDVITEAELDSEGELETQIGGANVIVETEIDSKAELEAIVGATLTVETDFDTESELEDILTDVSDIFTDNDGSLDEDDLTDNDITDLNDVSAKTGTGKTAVFSTAPTLTGNVQINDGLTVTDTSSFGAWSWFIDTTAFSRQFALQQNASSSDDNEILFYKLRNSGASPANDNDDLGTLRWNFLNSTSSQEEAAIIKGVVTDQTNTTEDAYLTFQTVTAGASLAEVFRLDGNVNIYSDAIFNNSTVDGIIEENGSALRFGTTTAHNLELGVNGNTALFIDDSTFNFSFGNTSASSSTYSFLNTGTAPIFTSSNGVFNLSTGELQEGGLAVATVTGTETLTNKTLTSPTINGATINTSTLDTPTIADLTNMTHDHSSDAEGGAFSTLEASTSMEAPIFQSDNADVADIGIVRFGNTECLAWELATPGTDGTLCYNSSDDWVFSNGFVGIGTDPTRQLHIYKDNADAGNLPSFLLEQDGTGDILMQFLLTGTQSWVQGIDNSDVDRLKFATSLSATWANSILALLVDGGFQLYDPGTKPTCNAARRGSVYYDAGGAGVADTYEMCGKSSADSYSWVALATF